jgi:hypothetical protein
MPEGSGQFATNRRKEGFPKDSDGENSTKQSHRFVAFPSLPLPVNITEIEPKRKFIENQSRCDSVEDRGDAAGEARTRWRARADFEQPQVANQEEKQDTPYHVMNVTSVHGDIVERTYVIVDGNRDSPNDKSGGEKSKRTQEEPLTACFPELMPINVTQLGSCDEQRKYCDDYADYKWTDPETSVHPGHEVLPFQNQSGLRLQIESRKVAAGELRESCRSDHGGIVG